MANWGKKHENLAKYLQEFLIDPDTFDRDRCVELSGDIEQFRAYGREEARTGGDLDAAYERLLHAVVEWCDRHPTPIPRVPRTQPTPRRRKQAQRAAHEPSKQQLEHILNTVRVSLVEFDAKLEKLNAGDFLARYNRIRVLLEAQSDDVPSVVFLTVRRLDSVYGADNVWIEALNVPELAALRSCVYDVLSFDAFNRPFSGIKVNLTTVEEYAISRAGPARPELTRFVAPMS